MPNRMWNDEDSVTLTHWMHGIEAPPFLAIQLRRKAPEYRGSVDRRQIIRFAVPLTITIDVGVVPVGTGAPEGDRNAGVNGHVLDTVTPAGPGACHDF